MSPLVWVIASIVIIVVSALLFDTPGIAIMFGIVLAIGLGLMLYDTLLRGSHR